MLLSLVLTILIEVVFAFCYGVRYKKDYILIFLVNVLTNPPVVLIHTWLLVSVSFHGLLVKLPLELLVIGIEAFFYKKYAKQIQNPVLFSFMVNACSFLIGWFINWFL
ncbi:hypothetical protein Cphy_2413 [Lachnoclostridium phytofermentans ISDg]|uniref:Uncharacterized protein n=1 Tax=Lachnoclostridium phytofermentans (strain ATCC 700394 / DSM 18823 / ISDg) TaxID=357809 RepID=A9KLN0_LACP7|nr:hypothetical protein Cphy_2413 [Lachnoclostridium phytofermentans ISDg]